jgi:EAL domain-containing protein (putative c-di-GMP-specific phosphodiesterase class I)
MLRDERLHMVFQPIVACTDPAQIFAYECLLRGTNDE